MDRRLLSSRRRSPPHLKALVVLLISMGSASTRGSRRVGSSPRVGVEVEVVVVGATLLSSGEEEEVEEA